MGNLAFSLFILNWEVLNYNILWTILVNLKLQVKQFVQEMTDQINLFGIFGNFNERAGHNSDFRKWEGNYTFHFLNNYLFVVF